MSEDEIKKALKAAINMSGLDTRTNIPDFILADYFMRAATLLASVHQAANEWRGIPLWEPGQTVTVDGPDRGLLTNASEAENHPRDALQDTATLLSEAERLRAVLAKIEGMETDWDEGSDGNMEAVREIARAALEGKP